MVLWVQSSRQDHKCVLGSSPQTIINVPFHYFPYSKIKTIGHSSEKKKVLHWLPPLLSLQMESVAQTLYIMYFVSITTLLFGSLGLFGAIKGKQWPLIMVGKPAVLTVFQTTWPFCPDTRSCVGSSLQLEWSSSASSWRHVRYQRWFFVRR